jgi:hypothetical protein
MKVLYLEGFSSGPGLPFPLLYGNNDIEVLHPRMPYYWIDILFNPYAWLSLCILSFVVSMILPQLLNFSRQSLKALLYYLLLLLISFHLLYYFKMLAVRWTVDICVSQMEKEITLHQPNVIIGYSWGGGIASFLIERKIWLGHTLLIAPAGSQVDLLLLFKYFLKVNLNLYCLLFKAPMIRSHLILIIGNYIKTLFGTGLPQQNKELI